MSSTLYSCSDDPNNSDLPCKNDLDCKEIGPNSKCAEFEIFSGPVESINGSDVKTLLFLYQLQYNNNDV